jgi:diacylglycerol kinase
MPKIKKMLKSFKYATKGIVYYVKTNNNFQFQLIAVLLVLFFAIGLSVTTSEFALLLFCISLVLSLEILNSAVEKLCDFIHPDRNKAIGHIKDLAAAAVLLASMGSALIAGIIFIPKIWELWSH